MLISCECILLDNQGFWCIWNRICHEGERKKKEMKIRKASLMLNLLHILRFFSFFTFYDGNVPHIKVGISIKEVLKEVFHTYNPALITNDFFY